MLIYICKRLLLFVPTLVLVSLLAFGLSQYTSGDPVSEQLSLQGIEPHQSGYLTSYKREYKVQTLDKPAFYATVAPQYITDDIQSIVDPVERRFVTTLTKQRYSSKDAKALLLVLRKHSLVHEEAEQVQRWLARAELSFIAEQATASGHISIAQMAEQMSPHSIHWPTIRWHGVDNRYHHWVSNLLRGDFGLSKVDGRPAASKIWSALQWTLLILVVNVLLTLLISVPYGLYTGLHVGGKVDRYTGTALFALYAMPTFWLATMLVILVTTDEYGMHVFPSVGMWYQGSETSFWEMIAERWPMLILPIGIIVVKDVAYLGRMIRDTVAGEAKKQYATTALSKGMNQIRYAKSHILPNALGPAITLAVGAIPSAIGGSLLIEVIFNIPGMGRLMYTSIQQADWSVVYPIVVLTAVMTVVWYLIGDVLISWLNPKHSL